MFSTGAAESTFSVDILHKFDEKERQKRNRVAKYFLDQIERSIAREYDKYKDHLLYRIPRVSGSLPMYKSDIIAIKVCKALRKRKNLTVTYVPPDFLQIRWKPRERSKMYIQELLRQIEAQIRFAYKRNSEIRSIRFQIPRVIKAFIYTIPDAAGVLVEKLDRGGFQTKFTPPNILDISWAPAPKAPVTGLTVSTEPKAPFVYNQFINFRNVSKKIH